jgi:ribonuclease HI
VYVADQDLGNCILSVNSEFESCTKFEQFVESKENEEIEQGIWEMYFDGASSLEGAGVGIMFISPSGTKEIFFSYRLEFETDASNNVCEYEALVIGLEEARKLKIKHLVVFGDVELIVRQVRQIYQAKHPRMRAYRNLVWDLIDNFFLTFNITAIPRLHNMSANALAIAASTFRPPSTPHLK